MSSVSNESSLRQTYSILSAIGRASHAQQAEQVASMPGVSVSTGASENATTSALREELTKLQELFDERWFAAGGGSLRTPSLGSTSTTWYLGAMLDEINERRTALGMEPYSPPSRQPSCGAWGCSNLYCEHPQIAQVECVTPSSLIAWQKRSRFPRREELPCKDCRARIREAVPGITEGSVPLCREGPEYSPLLCQSCKDGYAQPSTYLPPPPPLVRVNAFSYPTHLSVLSPPFPKTDEDDLMDRLRTFRSELQLKQDGLYREAHTAEEIAAADQESQDLDNKIYALEHCMLAFGAIFRHR